MYRYGRRSFKVIDELRPEYRAPLMDVIKIINISLYKGLRPQDEQTEAFLAGASTVEFPNSAHNPLYVEQKVFGFDAMPWHDDYPGGIDWRSDKEFIEAIARRDMDEAREILENIKRMRHTAGVIIGVFHVHGIPLINGNDWDADNKFNDHSFYDSPHYQHRDWKRLRHKEWRLYKDG